MAGTLLNAGAATLYIRQKSKDGNRSAISPQDLGAKKRKVRVVLTQDSASGTGAAGVLAPNDEINLFELPAGAYIDLKESYVKLSLSLGAATTISLGNRAYTALSGGAAVADSSNSLITNLDATVTTLVQLVTKTIGAGELLPVGLGIINFDSRGPVVIYMKALGASVVGTVTQTITFEFTYYVE